MKNIIKKVQTKKELEDAMYIRHQVFVIEQGVDESIEKDLHDDAADHFVVYAAGEAAGAARVRYLSDNIAKIERMAVLAEFRGKSIGKELFKFIIDFLKDKKIKEIVLNSQYHAKGFYEKFGFESEGEIFQEARIDHIKMKMDV